MTRYITIGLIWSVIATAIVWDIIAAIEPTPRDTISTVSLEYFWKRPVIPFFLGILIGHMSWPLDHEPNHLKISIPILAVLCIGVLILDLGGYIPRTIPMLIVLVGVICGHLLWPQNIW